MGRCRLPPAVWASGADEPSESLGLSLLSASAVTWELWSCGGFEFYTMYFFYQHRLRHRVTATERDHR